MGSVCGHAWVHYLDSRLHDDRYCNRLLPRALALVCETCDLCHTVTKSTPAVEYAHVKQSASASSRQRQCDDPFSFRGLKALLPFFCECSP